MICVKSCMILLMDAFAVPLSASKSMKSWTRSTVMLSMGKSPKLG